MVMAVHAAPVGCLPPPGASPAAVNPTINRSPRTGSWPPRAVRRCLPHWHRAPSSSDAPPHQGHPDLRGDRVDGHDHADDRHVRLRPLVADRAAHRGRPSAGRAQRRPGEDPAPGGDGRVRRVLPHHPDRARRLRLRPPQQRPALRHQHPLLRRRLPRRPARGGRPSASPASSASRSTTSPTSGSPSGSPRATPPTTRPSSSPRRPARCARSCWPWSSARRSPSCWPPASAGGRAAASCSRWAASRPPPGRSPPATSAPGSPSRATPISTGWPTRSTTWPTPCRPASSGRPASPPTSATSCAPRSPPSPPPPRSSTGAGASCPTARSRPSTSSSARSGASTPWSSTCSSCPASTPAPPTSTPRRSMSSPSAAASPTATASEPAHRRPGQGLQRLDPHGGRRQAAVRADPGQPPGERQPPRRRADPHLDRAHRRPVPARRRGGRRTWRRPGRAAPHLRALRPGQCRPPPHRHRPRPGPGLRARHGPRWRGVGRGPTGRRRPIRRPGAPRAGGEGADITDRRRPVVAGRGLATGCGIGGDSALEQIDRNDLFGLDETTTTSSTSTTTTTLVPPSSTAPDPGRESTTTIAIEPVLLYFLDGNRLVDVSINLARDPSATRVMAPSRPVRRRTRSGSGCARCSPAT